MIAGIDVRDALCFTPLIFVGLLLWVSLHRDRLMSVLFGGWVVLTGQRRKLTRAVEAARSEGVRPEVERVP